MLSIDITLFIITMFGFIMNKAFEFENSSASYFYKGKIMKEKNLTLKDVYFNQITTQSDEKSEQYLVDIAIDKDYKLSDSLTNINQKLLKDGFEEINHIQNQSAMMKSYIISHWINRYGYELDVKSIETFINQTLANKNIDFYFLSKYLNINNKEEFTTWLTKRINLLKDIDLIKSSVY